MRRKIEIVIRHKFDISQAVKAVQAASQGDKVCIEEPVRTTQQNRVMWLWLNAYSEQLPWVRNGRSCFLSPDDWKDVLTASFKHECHATESLDGRLVLLGARTSEFGQVEMAEFIEFIASEGTARGVRLEND